MVFSGLFSISELEDNFVLVHSCNHDSRLKELLVFACFLMEASGLNMGSGC